MMYTIYSKTDDLAISAPEGSTILQATLSKGIRHTHVCGGNGRCSTCRVYILEGLENCLPRNEKKHRIVHKPGFPEHIRLACQTKIRGDIAIKWAVIDEPDIEIILKQIGDETGTYFGKEIEIAVFFFDIENYTARVHRTLDIGFGGRRHHVFRKICVEEKPAKFATAIKRLAETAPGRSRDIRCRKRSDKPALPVVLVR